MLKRFRSVIGLQEKRFWLVAVFAFDRYPTSSPHASAKRGGRASIILIPSCNLGTLRSGYAFPFRAGLVKLAQLALAFSRNLEELPGQFDRLLFGVCIQNCESANHFFCFRERTVNHTQLATGSLHPGPEPRRQAALRSQQPALLHTLFNQLAHRRHFFLGRRGSTLNRL